MEFATLGGMSLCVSQTHLVFYGRDPEIGVKGVMRKGVQELPQPPVLTTEYLQ
jgi:hypothetical protein